MKQTTKHTDEQLMQLYVETNDQDAYAELYRRYDKPLYGCARKWIKNETAARDVADSTLQKIFTKKHLYQIGAPFSTWIFTILRNESIDYKRHASTVKRNVTNEFDMDLLLARNTSTLNIEEYLSVLPPLLRQTAEMYIFNKMKYHEMAKTLGVPLGTIKSRMNSARRKMREFESA